MERLGGCLTPKCRSLPSHAANPPVISRKLCACPNWPTSNFITAQCIAGVDADSNHIARLDAFGASRLDRLIHDQRISIGGRRCGGEHIQPSWCDHAHPERYVTGIDEVNAHISSPKLSLDVVRFYFTSHARQSDRWVVMEVETKFLRLFKPAALGDRIDGWCVCWVGGWGKCRVLFVVMVERPGAPVGLANALQKPDSEWP